MKEKNVKLLIKRKKKIREKKDPVRESREKNDMDLKKPLNLSKEETLGLVSIKKRIKSGELVKPNG